MGETSDDSYKAREVRNAVPRVPSSTWRTTDQPVDTEIIPPKEDAEEGNSSLPSRQLRQYQILLRVAPSIAVTRPRRQLTSLLLSRSPLLFGRGDLNS